MKTQKTSPKQADLVLMIEQLSAALDDTLRSHGASMPPEKFTQRYSRVVQARLMVSRCKKIGRRRA